MTTYYAPYKALVQAQGGSLLFCLKDYTIKHAFTFVFFILFSFFITFLTTSFSFLDSAARTVLEMDLVTHFALLHAGYISGFDLPVKLRTQSD